MADFTADLLDRPAVEAACVVALAHLDDAATAATRLSDQADTEALHDFRVALRRLRVTVRAYPGLHESVPKKQRRRLRKLSRATNAARDAEVQIAWFRKRAARLAPAQRAALGPLRARLRARKRRERTLALLKLQQRFGKVERKIRRRLAAFRTDAGTHEPLFRGVAAAALVQHAKDLTNRLKEAKPAAELAELHATRIAAKRLRYLVEPVADVVSGGRALIERLKHLQDVFGELTDAHVLEAELQRAAAAAPDGGKSVAPAADLLRGEIATLLAKLQNEWPAAREDLAHKVDAAARELNTPLKPAPTRLARRAPRRRRGVTV